MGGIVIITAACIPFVREVAKGFFEGLQEAWNGETVDDPVDPNDYKV